MSTDVDLSCRCGEVHGRVRDVSMRTVNRVVCYCDDCQAFLHHLKRADLLDARGGSEIVQVAPASVSFDRGASHIACARLSPKGLYRWYASCCDTPLGNTVKPSIPFVGINMDAFRSVDERRRDDVFGALRGAVQGRFAIGGAPPGSTRPSLGMIAHILRLMIGWKLRKGWPSPFFERSGEPRYPITTLSRAERDALRPLCGPSPAKRATAA